MTAQQLLALATQLESVLIDHDMHPVQRNRLKDAVRALNELAKGKS